MGEKSAKTGKFVKKGTAKRAPSTTIKTKRKLRSTDLTWIRDKINETWAPRVDVPTVYEIIKLYNRRMRMKPT